MHLSQTSMTIILIIFKMVFNSVSLRLYQYKFKKKKKIKSHTTTVANIVWTVKSISNAAEPDLLKDKGTKTELKSNKDQNISGICRSVKVNIILQLAHN